MTFNRLARAALVAAPLALLAVPSVVGIVRADSAADLETARLLLKEGNALREKGDLRGALAKYKAAHSIVYTPITGLEVGRTHLALGELIEAREAFLAAGRMPVKAQESQNATAARLEAGRLAAELEPRIPTLVISAIAPKGATATITLDGQPLPAASFGGPRKVDPGAHHIVAKADGTNEASADVNVAEGEKRTVTLTLQAPSPVASPATLPSSSKDLVVHSSGRSPLVYLGFGVAATGFVVGGITGVLTLSKASSLGADCPQNQCGPSHHDDLHSARTFGTISTISFLVAGVGAAVGIVGLFAHSSDKSPSDACARVIVGLGTVGLGGAF